MEEALAILGVVGGFVGPAIHVAKLIAAPVRHQFTYLCCFRSNINSLRDEARNLNDQTRGLHMKVDAATNNAQRIHPKVETWLRNSDEMKNEVNVILDEAPDIESGCLKFRERYSLRKKTHKTAIAIKEHIVEKCNFNDSMILSDKTSDESESRREIEQKIMKLLEDKNVHKIGICGMGGLGKTTMAEKIMIKVQMNEGLFEDVVKAVVSQPVDKLNIQLQIAKQFGVRFTDETLIPRADILHRRLRRRSGKKRSLLILDDVWENLDIEELGIPCEEDGCTVLLTSRNRDVLRAMGVENICEIKKLEEEEAWSLFRDKAGTYVDEAALNPIAKNVMRECKGLPIALTTVGLALEGVNRISTWEDALGQLRKSNPPDIPSIITLFYTPLKLSYDRLGSENAKSMLLLCCVFAEDYDIPLEHLTYSAIGLRLFEDAWDLEGVKGRICTLIENLKSRCLLLDGSDKDHVRMHAMVRDVFIYITSKEKRVNCDDCTWISSFVYGRAILVPPQSVFPKVKLLIMKTNYQQQDMEINGILIGGSTKLKVFFIEYGSLKSLSVRTTQSLKSSLTTLVLRRCASLLSIAVVGQLKSLKILICRYCDLIKELPEQVEGLKRLKLL